MYVDLWQNFYVLVLINILSCNSKIKGVKITDLPVIPAMVLWPKQLERKTAHRYWSLSRIVLEQKYHGRYKMRGAAVWAVAWCRSTLPLFFPRNYPKAI